MKEGLPAWIERYFEWVLTHPKKVWLVVACITVAALAALSQGVLASSLEQMFFGDDPEFSEYRERARTFVNDELFVVAYPDEAPVSSSSLARLERAVSKISQHPDVGTVRSLADLSLLEGDDGTLIIEGTADAIDRLGEQETVERVVADRLTSGLMISKDQRHGVIVVEMSVDGARTAEQGPALVSFVVDALVEAGFERDDLHLAGQPAVLSAVIQITYESFGKLAPMVGFLLFSVVWILFRQVTPAVVCLGVSAIAGIWTLGFATLLDRNINIFVSFTPMFTLIVAFSDIVHLWSAFQSELAEGKARREAVLAAAVDVGRACVFTSITTGGGFLSLALLPTPMFRQGGFVMGFGVTAALLLAMTVVPIILLRYGQPAPSAQVAGVSRRLLNGALALATRWSLQSPKRVVFCFGLFAIACGYGLTFFTVETDMTARFHEDHRVRVDQAFFDEQLAGTNNLDVFVRAPEAEGLLDPELLEALRQARDQLEATPEIDKVVSVVDLFESMHKALGGEGPLPQTRAHLVQYLLLFEMSGGEDLARLIDEERQEMPLRVQIPGYGMRETTRIGETAEEVIQEAVGERADVTATGMVYLFGGWLDSLIAWQKRSLAASFSFMFVMMLLAVRALRPGVLSMIPNVIPAVAVAAYCGFFWEHTDSDTFTPMIMALGIGVDDTIHFLVRFRIERERGYPVEEAIRRTFEFSGRAILMTTAILALGFLPFATSAYFTTWMIGVLIPLSLAMAVVSDLLLVPAMCQLGWIRFGGPDE